METTKIRSAGAIIGLRNTVTIENRRLTAVCLPDYHQALSFTLWHIQKEVGKGNIPILLLQIKEY
uniref:Uncharacterized protein n=1 Tax=Lepeophtheirus salmonis TaxID=72036 RepID=A0A0K2T912_LEPSM